MKTPEALRLAHWLERDGANCQQHLDAAIKLRQLHKFSTELLHLLRLGTSSCSYCQNGRAYFAYGPISTALRKLAKTGKETKGLAGRLAIRAAAYEWKEGHTDPVLFYLFLAEALADEGM